MSRIARVLIVMGLLFVSTPGASAQESPPTTLSLTTPFVGVLIKPGDNATFPIDVAAPTGTRVHLQLSGLPEGWDSRLQGGGFELDEVLVGATGHESVELSVNVPADAADGSYDMTLVGDSGSGSVSLGLTLTVTAEAGGEVTMTTDFPSLNGPSDSTYSFSLILDNGTPQEIQFGLAAEGPPGWQIDVRPAGEANASTVTVGGGESATVTVDVDPADDAEAAVYTMVASAEGGGHLASVELAVEITGTFGIELTGASEVLSLDVTANETSTFDMVVVNTGTAPLQAITLAATPPIGWEVTFEPAGVGLLEAGASAPVTATITPSGEAINGDYLISMTASVPEATSTAQIRATVKTSAVWGLVGVGVIVVALLGLTMVFRRYGRR